MTMNTTTTNTTNTINLDITPKKKPVSWQNLAIGATIQVFEVSTLGQPFEVLKTHMAGTIK